MKRKNTTTRSFCCFCPVSLAPAWQAEQLMARAAEEARLSGIREQRTSGKQQECVRTAGMGEQRKGGNEGTQMQDNDRGAQCKKAGR